MLHRVLPSLPPIWPRGEDASLSSRSRPRPAAVPSATSSRPEQAREGAGMVSTIQVTATGSRPARSYESSDGMSPVRVAPHFYIQYWKA